MAGKKKRDAGPFEALRPLKDRLTAEAQDGKKPKAPPPAPAPAKPAGPPEDEALLLHRMFAGVQPLDRSRGSRLAKQEVARSPAVEERSRRGHELARQEADQVHEHLRSLVEGRQARFEVADDGRRVEGRRVDLPMDALRRLRRGLLPIDARLDLHGLGTGPARTQLELFLRTTRARGERCVLVIHGKGEHSPNGVGALRGEIAAWLSQGPASEHVGAFSTADERDGGEGAVYVLLRR